jgi:hypothetical protein
MVQAYAVSRPFFDDDLAERNDMIARRFVDAFGRALPHVPQEELFWRYYLVIGGLLQLTSDAVGLHRLERLSGGLCKFDDADRVVEELVAVFLKAMDAPAPSANLGRVAD